MEFKTNDYITELSKEEQLTIQGGSWLTDVAGFVGYCAGTLAHAIVDAAHLVTGSDMDQHN